MEELNKHQIVLLTLLVSFVTSIATGIVTVSLMEQAPANVVQTINRVVERTVETVVPAENQNAAVVTKETTVVVKEDDLITDTIAHGAENVVRIFKQVTLEDGSVVTRLANIGVVFRGDGVIVSENSRVPEGGAYTGVYANGDTYPLEVLGTDTERELVFLQVDEAKLAEGESVPALARPQGVDLTTLQLGQSVVALGGTERSVAAVGIIASIITGEETVPATIDTATTTKSYVSFIQANVVPSATVYGGPLFTIFGELIGIHTQTQDGAGLFLPLTQIAQAYSALATLDSETVSAVITPIIQQ